MTEEKSQEIKKVDNSAYRDKFRFLLYVNNNVIVERFFKINGFNNEVLHSSELRDAIYEIVFRNPNANFNDDEKPSLRDDLISKSRVYEWYTVHVPFKMIGFKKDGTGYKNGRDCKFFEVKIEDFNPEKMVFSNEYESAIFNDGQVKAINHSSDERKIVVELNDGTYQELNLISYQKFSNYDVYTIDASYDGIDHELKAYRSVMTKKPLNGGCFLLTYYRWNDVDRYEKVAEYLDYPDLLNEEINSEEDSSTTDFKFSLQVASDVKYVDDNKPIYDNYKPIYECYFDGSMLPRYIRTNVNIANTQFQDKTKAPFWRDIDKKLVTDRADLIYYTIKKICDVTNLGESEDKTYVKSEVYTNDNLFRTASGRKDEKTGKIIPKNIKSRTYNFNPINKKAIESWRNYTKEKTEKYFKDNFPNMVENDKPYKKNN